MTIALLEVGDVVALGYDSATNERGFLVKMINLTGGNTVKGELVSCSTGTDQSFVKQANEYDTIGVIQEAGVANASSAWVWVNGSICQVLYKDGSSATHGNILMAADTDGRAMDVTNPGSGLPATENHFKECGHVLESKSSGTNVLALAILHFN